MAQVIDDSKDQASSSYQGQLSDLLLCLRSMFSRGLGRTLRVSDVIPPRNAVLYPKYVGDYLLEKLYFPCRR